MDPMEHMDKLKKQMEQIRVELHSAYAHKRSFADKEVYALSERLDVVIAEYQREMSREKESPPDKRQK